MSGQVKTRGTSKLPSWKRNKDKKKKKMKIKNKDRAERYKNDMATSKNKGAFRS